MSIVVLEEGFRAESISVCNTTHLAIRDLGTELHRAWGCPGGPSWNWEWLEPWLTEGQSRLGWRKLRACGFSVLGGGREQLGRWARALCCAGLNVTSLSPVTWLVAEPRDYPLVWVSSDASVSEKSHMVNALQQEKKPKHGMRKSSDAVSNFHSNVLFIRG